MHQRVSALTAASASRLRVGEAATAVDARPRQIAPTTWVRATAKRRAGRPPRRLGDALQPSPKIRKKWPSVRTPYQASPCHRQSIVFKAKIRTKNRVEDHPKTLTGASFRTSAGLACSGYAGGMV